MIRIQRFRTKECGNTIFSNSAVLLDRRDCSEVRPKGGLDLLEVKIKRN